MSRTFEYAPAVRKSLPLILGIVGPTGSGKTKSALRWASGIQQVAGGDVAVVDSEASRAAHYADQHKFHHVPFAAPFGPLDYLAALEFAVNKGAKTVVVDSGSHMHEGPGGMLEQHDAELARMGGRQSMSFPAWAKPKAELRRFINTLQQLRVNLIMCFRAQDKSAMPEKGAKDADGRPVKDLIDLGMMPIAPKGLIYEFAACPILLPGSKGRPTWESEYIGEASVIKMPNYLEAVFADGRVLDEEHGRQMATWAAGGPSAGPVTSGVGQRWIAYWEKRGVSVSRLFSRLGRAMGKEFTKEDDKTMNGWVAELKAQTRTVDDIFAIGDEPAPELPR